MSVEISPVGGWGEVGRNMTAVRVNDDVFIFDMGLHLPNYIKITEECQHEFIKWDESILKKADAIPQDKNIKDWRDKVKAIVISHAHLDHLGAVPYLADKYDAPIVCTPFTAAVLHSILRDEKINISNKIVQLKPGRVLNFGENRIEFVRTTHSTPQTVFAVLHTKKGAIIYGNDYKLDKHPTLGRPPNYERLKELSKKRVLALIQDCLYADKPRKTPSERVVKEMLHDVLIDLDSKGKGIIVTTFASHIARLKTISEFGKKIKRKVIFMGRSLAKYSFAAKDANIIDLEKNARILKYARQIRLVLNQIAHDKHKYLLVVSGHQGEPKSTLSKMIDGVFKFNFDAGDHMIFSSQIIPADINRKNREIMDKKLKDRGVRIFSDIHVSGHSSREDLRDAINLIKPKHLLPTHGDEKCNNAFTTLAIEMGFKPGKNLHVLKNNERISL